MQCLPGVRGTLIHVLNVEAEPLLARLRACGYEAFVLDGAAIHDERSFLDVAGRALGFEAQARRWGDWPINGWNAFSDYLLGLPVPAVGGLAIVWKDADICLAADAQVFVEALTLLWVWASDTRKAGTPPRLVQRDVFLLGQGEGFKIQVSLS